MNDTALVSSPEPSSSQLTTTTDSIPPENLVADVTLRINLEMNPFSDSEASRTDLTESNGNTTSDETDRSESTIAGSQQGDDSSDDGDDEDRPDAMALNQEQERRAQLLERREKEFESHMRQLERNEAEKTRKDNNDKLPNKTSPRDVQPKSPKVPKISTIISPSPPKVPNSPMRPNQLTPQVPKIPTTQSPTSPKDHSSPKVTQGTILRPNQSTDVQPKSPQAPKISPIHTPKASPMKFSENSGIALRGNQATSPGLSPVTQASTQNVTPPSDSPKHHQSPNSSGNQTASGDTLEDAESFSPDKSFKYSSPEKSSPDALKKFKTPDRLQRVSTALKSFENEESPNPSSSPFGKPLPQQPMKEPEAKRQTILDYTEQTPKSTAPKAPVQPKLSQPEYSFSYSDYQSSTVDDANRTLFKSFGTIDGDAEDEEDAKKPKKTVSIDENKNEVINLQRQANTIELKMDVRGSELAHEIEAENGRFSFNLNENVYVDMHKRFSRSVTNPVMKVFVYEIDEDTIDSERKCNYIYGCEMELLEREYVKQVSFLTTDNEITKIAMSRE